MTQLWKSLLVRGIPAVVIVVLTVAVLRGDGGLFRYWELQEASHEARGEWAALERRNTELLFELRQLQADPIQMERLVAEELGYAQPGAVLYRFDVDADGARVPEGGATAAPPAPVD